MGTAVTQAVSRRGGQSATVTGLSPSASVCPCQFQSTNAPYSPSKSSAVSEIGARWIEKYFQFCFQKGTGEVRAEAEETVEHRESNIIDCKLTAHDISMLIDCC
jgi:hypothetical protein